MGKKNGKKAIKSGGLKSALHRHLLKDEMKRKVAKKAQHNAGDKGKTYRGGGPIKMAENGGTAIPVEKALVPFEPESRVLLVGEGDFSFATSIIEEGLVQPQNLIATSFDSEEEVCAKYSEGEKNLVFLRESGVKIIHKVDGTDLVSGLKIAPTGGKNRKNGGCNKLFDDGSRINVVMFNFPHTGKGIKDFDRNIRENQKLVLGFMKSCNALKQILESDRDQSGYFGDVGINWKVVISLFEGEPYLSWTVKALAKSEGYKVERSGKFVWERFPSYHHRRTNSMFDTTKPAEKRNARIYMFEKLEPSKD